MKTRTKRNSNKKTLATAGLVALAAVSVFSVGFASWIIGSETMDSTDQFTVNVESVTDSRVQFTASMDPTDNTITLGAQPSNAAGLIRSDASAVEDLTFSFTINATCEDFTTNFKGLGFYYSDGKTGASDPKISTYLSGETTKNNIVWPGSYTATYIPLVSAEWSAEGDYFAVYNGTTVLEVEKTGVDDPECNWKVNINLADDNKSAIITVTCYVKWGSAFQGMNPVLDEAMDEPNIEDIKAAIQTFAQINGATNVINIKHPTTAITIDPATPGA